MSIINSSVFYLVFQNLNVLNNTNVQLEFSRHLKLDWNYVLYMYFHHFPQISPLVFWTKSHWHWIVLSSHSKLKIIELRYYLDAFHSIDSSHSKTNYFYLNQNLNQLLCVQNRFINTNIINFNNILQLFSLSRKKCRMSYLVTQYPF